MIWSPRLEVGGHITVPIHDQLARYADSLLQPTGRNTTPTASGTEGRFSFDVPRDRREGWLTVPIHSRSHVGSDIGPVHDAES
jgi:hypothetical protein